MKINEKPNYRKYLNKPLSIVIDKLSSENPFLMHNINLNKEENDCLDKLIINNELGYSNYGDFDNLQQGIKDFIISLGNEAIDSEYISSIITKTIYSSLDEIKEESAWVSMGSFTENDLFSVPRWHIDGRFFLSNPDIKQYKIITAIKGPSTLFYPLSKESRSEFNKIHEHNLKSVKNE